MATIRRRGNTFQVQIRRANHPPRSRTFSQYSEAKIWAREIEAKLDRCATGSIEPSKATLGDILEKYVESVTPQKKGKVVEQRRIQRLLRDPIADVTLASLSSQVVATFRDRRREDGIRACQYDLVLIRHALEIARFEWGLVLPENPVDKVRKPPTNKPRERRLMPGEYEALKTAAQKTKAQYLWPLITLAIETGMRKSELLGLKWSDIDLKTKTAFLAETKNGTSRSVPLSSVASLILERLSKENERLFPVTDIAARHAWDRLVKRAGIYDLHFHDLRHEAISRFFERGLSVPEVALISGHKDLRTLFRYTHLRVQEVGKKLN